MSKPKLLIADCGFAEPWFMPYWTRYFDCEVYQSDKNYAKDTVALVDDRYEKEIYQKLQDQGLHIVRPYLMDSLVYNPSKVQNGELILRAKESVWIQESIMFDYRGYNTRREAQVPGHFFLLLINRLRDNKRQLLERVGDYLPSSLYTCVQHGIFLPGDNFVPGRDVDINANDRFYVPQWYADTGFSLVAETHVSNAKYPGLYVSEKSCKPLAHAHAFVTYGPAGILKYWQHLGFETFSHRINESYDNELNPDKKLQMIMAVLEDLYSEFTSTGQVFQDAKTQAILSHNQNLFFNRERIEKLFEQQIVDPIMEFLEST